MLVGASQKSLNRVTGSVLWTETYRDRVQQLLSAQTPNQGTTKYPPPMRAILLQDCFGGKDALAMPVGRDEITFGYNVSIVGSNVYNSANSFKLKLFGINDATDTTTLKRTLIGTSGVIKQISTAAEFLTALQKISSLITPDTATVMLGNPYFDRDLLLYGTVQPEVQFKAATATVEATRYSPPSSLLGMWFVQLPPSLFLGYNSIEFTAFLDSETVFTGLTNIGIEQTFDLPSPETTVVTDINYRTSAYAWQAGTMVTCLDFMDIGYGIIQGTARNLQVTVPAN